MSYFQHIVQVNILEEGICKGLLSIKNINIFERNNYSNVEDKHIKICILTRQSIITTRFRPWTVAKYIKIFFQLYF